MNAKLALLLVAASVSAGLVAASAAHGYHIAWLPECEDTHDNDSDGLTDWPDDPGCLEGPDNDEYNSPAPPDPQPPPPPPPPAPPSPPPAQIPQCEDGIDNDGDGLVDYGQDPGCSDWWDNEEYNAPPQPPPPPPPLPPPPPPPPPSPSSTSLPCDGSEGVYLYEHRNYAGRCSRFVDDSPEASGWAVGNDRTSSIRVVGPFVAVLYEHASYGGASSVFGEDSPDASGWAVGNDRASSIAVERLPAELACEASNTCPGPDAAESSYDRTAYEPYASPDEGYQVYPYSISSCWAGDLDKIRDPVSVVFYYYATADRSLNHIRAHTGWHVRPTPSQYFQSWDSCGKAYGEAASGRAWSSRFHVRIRKAARRFGSLRVTSLATPHHEDFVVNDFLWRDSDCVHAVDKGGVGPNGGGLYSGFMWGRDELFYRMTVYSHHSSFWENWGHTIEKRQCDGDWAGGDGWVAFIKIPNSYH